MDINVSVKQKRVSKEAMIFTILPLLFFTASLALVFFVAIPRNKQKPLKETELKQLKEKNVNLQKKIEKLNDLADFREIIEENTRLVDSALPSQADVPLLLTQIQQISKESGLSIANLSYSSSGSGVKNESSQVNVFMSAKGNFGQVKTFLTTLEKASRIIDISTLRITSQQGTQPDALGASAIDLSTVLVSSFLPVEDRAEIEDPLTVDIRDQGFINIINKLKEYKIYENKVDNTNIGKDNPFNP
ncbi:type 4a pilus biogenesis protein PilO [candidate division WWE3 bacterium]|nr:type 4a pilus biogenesis protein PilO [candidate division WWE3 bacterium]